MNLPKTQVKALEVVTELFSGEPVAEYAARTAGANVAALGALVAKGYLTRERKPFIMPEGPYAGEALSMVHYSLA